MPLDVSCPTCRTSFKIAEQHAGKHAKCSKCGTRFVVDRASSGTSDFPSITTPVPAAPPAKPPVPPSITAAPPVQRQSSMPASFKTTSHSSPDATERRPPLSNQALVGLTAGGGLLLSVIVGLTVWLIMRPNAPVPIQIANAEPSSSVASGQESKPKPQAELPEANEPENHKAADNTSSVARSVEPGPTERKEASAEPASENLGSWGTSHGLESGTIKRIADVDVVLGFKSSVVYLPMNASDGLESNKPSLGLFFPVGYRKSGELFADHTGGFIPINGKAEKISYRSSNDLIARVHDDGSAGFHKGGNVDITMSLAGESISVPLRVIEVPVKASRQPKNATNVGDVVGKLGFPDRKSKHYISWPKSELIDGIFYSPSVRGGIATEHWEYDAYPAAVIAIVGNSTSGWVWCVGTKTGK